MCTLSKKASKVTTSGEMGFPSRCFPGPAGKPSGMHWGRDQSLEERHTVVMKRYSGMPHHRCPTGSVIVLLPEDRQLKGRGSADERGAGLSITITITKGQSV